MILNIFTDGGARGNPGPASAGVVIKNNQGKTIFSKGFYIGKATNNVAEYHGVIKAFEWLINNRGKIKAVKKINFYLDSRLVASQLKGDFKIKAPHLAVLVINIKNKEKTFHCPVNYFYIPREKNKEADAMVNKALDEREI